MAKTSQHVKILENVRKNGVVFTKNGKFVTKNNGGIMGL